MRIQIGHSTDFDFEKEFCQPIKKSKLFDEHEFVFPHENEKEMSSQNSLKRTHLFVAEASYPSTGLRIQLGFVYSYNLPIICFFKTGSKVSSSLKHIAKEIIEYSDAQDLVEKLGTAINNYIDAKNENLKDILSTFPVYDNFFDIEMNPLYVNIKFVQTREEMDKLAGRPTPDRHRAFVKGKTMHIFDRAVLESQSSHTYNETEYLHCLKHELGHVYFGSKTQVSNPRWLNEGTCIYLSGQLEERNREPKSFKNFLNFFYKGGEGVYSESGFFVRFIVEKFGRENFIKLLDEVKNIFSPEDLDESFKEIYGFGLDYESINNIYIPRTEQKQ